MQKKTNLIDKILKRGENIEVLVQKTDEIQLGAGEFRRGTNTVKKAMLARFIILIVVIVVVLIVRFLSFAKLLGYYISNWIGSWPWSEERNSTSASCNQCSCNSCPHCLIHRPPK
jgi:hypothetical protein